MSETSKYRAFTTGFCKGNGIDIGSQNDPVVPWAISFDLPQKEYTTYSSGQAPENSIQWRGDAISLPFKDAVCDFVYSSHLIEDFYTWYPYLQEWARVLKPGGYLVILVPDKQRWNAAIAKGQNPNCAHRHESRVGELSEHIKSLGGFEILEDRLTNLSPEDYTILFVARKH
jgi:SAM-dependent methyltransferase